MAEFTWQLPSNPVPEWFGKKLAEYGITNQPYLTQLLWQRELVNWQELEGFLNPNFYQPRSAADFGQEIKRAVNRLLKAREKGEKVTIWGDFDADGITATSLLWEGLGQFFKQGEQLDYYIPDRLLESHGLNLAGLKKLANTGTKLIVTCDTGSTNLEEIVEAAKLGIDIIITDHHTLPDERPPVVAILNPRYFAETHPLYHLSGVAVAYKLVEGLYSATGDQGQQPLENLLDLVAIGLIADLVELKGDCRYLAQKGIEQLQKQAHSHTYTRPGVYHLLNLCKKNGDRPTDIGFGIGPRLNAVSRIQGDGSFLVELLTSKDEKRCLALARAAELANSRRQELQGQLTKKVEEKVKSLDLSTTSVIVLEDPAWSGGLLGLVANTIASKYGRPTILLSSDGKMARGSARSIQNIDLYELVRSQAHLLTRFGGHPFAAGLSLPLDNLGIFRESINQVARCQHQSNYGQAILEIDLVVTVAELGQALFKELKLLEPYGMGNPIPKLLVRDCRFQELWQKNREDWRGQKVSYIRTTFELWDDSSNEGFPGCWWGHYKDELPTDLACDVVVELDFNAKDRKYHVRLIDWQPSKPLATYAKNTADSWLIDGRGQQQLPPTDTAVSFLQDCPTNWGELTQPYHHARRQQHPLALVYSLEQDSPEEIWKQLLGIAKYLQRTAQTVTYQQLSEKLNFQESTVKLALKVLKNFGFIITTTADNFTITDYQKPKLVDNQSWYLLLEIIREEQFQREYFYQAPISTLAVTLEASREENHELF